MPPTKPPFTPETFRFFRDLKKNNKKVWMDANRDRYQDTVVQPFRRALEAMAPAMLAIDDRFDVRGVTGANFLASTAISALRKTKRLTGPRCI
jgi:uncharacterized protein (DUF2461 family)